MQPMDGVVGIRQLFDLQCCCERACEVPFTRLPCEVAEGMQGIALSECRRNEWQAFVGKREQTIEIIRESARKGDTMHCAPEASALPDYAAMQ